MERCVRVAALMVMAVLIVAALGCKGEKKNEGQSDQPAGQGVQLPDPPPIVHPTPPVTPPTPPQPTPPQPQTTEYTIQAGDTLTNIARKELGDANRWKEIVKLNHGINPNRLKIGAKIKLPAKASPATLRPVTPTTNSVSAPPPVHG